MNVKVIVTSLLIPLYLCLPLVAATAQDFCNVEYLCADWGPAMTLSGKTNEPPQFSETEEEVYFLKQLTFFTRKPLAMPELISGQQYRDIGTGLAVWLCKMKPDGTGKTEIKELWHEPDAPINTQSQSTWMDINVKSRKIALSIRFGGRSMTGLWTMTLDGSRLTRIIQPGVKPANLGAVNHPSWSPDGKWLVFEEPRQSMGDTQSQIYRCEPDGNKLVRLTEETNGEWPCISPDGQQIAYIHWIRKGDVNDSWLWLMDPDGKNKRPLTNPKAHKNWTAQAHWGTCPAWSPDGKRIFVLGVSSTIIEAITGNEIRVGVLPQSGLGWPHWGKRGVLCIRVCGISVGDLENRRSKILAACSTSECQNNTKLTCRW